MGYLTYFFLSNQFERLTAMWKRGSLTDDELYAFKEIVIAELGLSSPFVVVAA